MVVLVAVEGRGGRGLFVDKNRVNDAVVLWKEGEKGGS